MLLLFHCSQYVNYTLVISLRTLCAHLLCNSLVEVVWPRLLAPQLVSTNNTLIVIFTYDTLWLKTIKVTIDSFKINSHWGIFSTAASPKKVWDISVPLWKLPLSRSFTCHRLGSPLHYLLPVPIQALPPLFYVFYLYINKKLKKQY